MDTIISNKVEQFMIINRFLNNLFTAPSIISVLRQLNMRNDGLTGREVARLENITHRTALKSLDNLESLNLVTKRVAGKSYYYTINRNQYIYKEIISVIFEKELEYKQKVFNEIKSVKNENLISTIIFGSVARKEETYKSDLDVCFIYKKNKSAIEEKINNLRDKIYDNYGVSLAPFYITVNDFIAKAKKSLPPVNNILEEGIVISGKPIKRIIHG